jgi:hypothetical protein
LNSTSEAHSPVASKWPSAFQILKYLVFITVLVNLVFYLTEDITSYLYLDESASIADVLQTFAVTFDYVAWMTLAVLFEMETSARASAVSHGVRRWVVSGLTAVCYGVLVYAAYNYVVNLSDAYYYQPIASETVCGLVEDKFAYLDSSARPIELTAENCGAFAGEQVYRAEGDHLIVTHANLMALRKLSWVDIANAAAWLLVILIFQIEISLEQFNKLTKPRLVFCTAIKIFLYLVLAADAVYWTIYSSFIDYWDAWIWLLAFVLIDMNLLGVDDGGGNRKTARGTRSVEAGEMG